MEGAHRHSLRGTLPHQVLQALLQLLSGPAGEGHHGDLLRLHAAIQQVSHPGGEGACLSRAGARHHRHPAGLGLHRLALGIVQAGLGHGRGLLFPRRRRLLHGPFLGPGSAGHGNGAKQAHLAVESLHFLRCEQPHLAVDSVVARLPDHFPGPQAADRLPHRRARGGADGLNGHLPQDGELRPQGCEQLLIEGLGALAGLRASGGVGDDLWQGDQALKGVGMGAGHAGQAVRQLLHPVLHPDGQPLAAHRAPVPQGSALPRRQPHAAAAVAIQMVFALLREELHRAHQALAGVQGVL